MHNHHRLLLVALLAFGCAASAGGGRLRQPARVLESPVVIWGQVLPAGTHQTDETSFQLREPLPLFGVPEVTHVRVSGDWVQLGATGPVMVAGSEIWGPAFRCVRTPCTAQNGVLVGGSLKKPATVRGVALESFYFRFMCPQEGGATCAPAETVLVSGWLSGKTHLHGRRLGPGRFEFRHEDAALTLIQGTLGESMQLGDVTLPPGTTITQISTLLAHTPPEHGVIRMGGVKLSMVQLGEDGARVGTLAGDQVIDGTLFAGDSSLVWEREQLMFFRSSEPGEDLFELRETLAVLPYDMKAYLELGGSCSRHPMGWRCARKVRSCPGGRFYESTGVCKRE